MKTFNVTVNCDDGRKFEVKNVKAINKEKASDAAWRVHPKNGGVPFGWSMIGITDVTQTHLITYDIKEVA